jgi:hypothetical protein
MDIQSIKNIFSPVIADAIKAIESEGSSINVTLLKRIINECVDSSLNRDTSSLSSVVADFSGRGRAWAKVKVSDSNPVWINIKHLLQEKMLEDEEMFKRSSNMIDVFEDAGIAWMRFSGVNNKAGLIRFQLRLWGSKLEDHIKFNVDKTLYGYIENLDGVPHNLKLETGNFLQETETKQKIEGVVSKEELSNLGIQTLEDLLGED